MKNLLIGLILLLGTSSFAHAELEDQMKIIGDQFKILGKSVQTKSFSAAELDAVEVMQSAVAEAALIYPHTATDDAAKLKYSKYMAELMKMALMLETQGELIVDQSPQNMADVTATLMEMNELRKEAHAIFKED